MVSSKEYFYHLRRAFATNRKHGYAINQKVNDCICIYFESNRWIVSRIKNDVAIDAKSYDENDLWDACEEITRRLSKDDKQYEKIWQAWASPVNWSEKMNEPLEIHVISKESIAEQ